MPYSTELDRPRRIWGSCEYDENPAIPILDSMLLAAAITDSSYITGVRHTYSGSTPLRLSAAYSHATSLGRVKSTSGLPPQMKPLFANA